MPSRSFTRSDRLAAELRRLLGTMVHEVVRDNALPSMSVSDVECSKDFDVIVLLDKPQGLSSNQAMERGRHQFRARKAGHTGSLDPLATGLLPICFGEATKIAGYLLGARKAYAAECRLGTTTTTDDSEGEVIETRAVPALSVDTIGSALKNLRGSITPIPPIYSPPNHPAVTLYQPPRP